MSLFSQRRGIKPEHKVVQIDRMDDELRNSLWNAMFQSLWNHIETNSFSPDYNAPEFEVLFGNYWLFFFKKPEDSRPKDFGKVISELRSYFFGCEWHEAYDFLEFTLKQCPQQFKGNLKKWCNLFLTLENSAFRIVDYDVVEITSQEEIDEIEEALNNPIAGVKAHIKTSIGHLSSREKPDYRNSVKESVCSVEALARAVANEPKATLGELIKTLETHAGIHPALKKAFSALYGYTSDEGGIRHSLLEESSISKSEATFMLISCSAFVNYVLAKCSEHGIEIKKKISK
ncbi:MAG: AbiJ-NTD4 domain-containing protein [Candidatus Hodarchaeota archaeon]